MLVRGHKNAGRKVIDLLGKQFGRLIVIAGLGTIGTNPHKQAVWLVSCVCGNERLVRGDSLRLGRTKSCGCLNDEVRRSRLLGRLKSPVR
jgi:hypothetical protein